MIYINILNFFNYFRPNRITKIKFKVPSKNITIVEEFLRTSSLSNLKTYISNKVNLSER